MDLGYITEAEFDEVENSHLGPVRRMLTNLLFKVRGRRQIGGAKAPPPSTRIGPA
jgi:hypothetical protein